VVDEIVRCRRSYITDKANQQRSELSCVIGLTSFQSLTTSVSVLLEFLSKHNADDGANEQIPHHPRQIPTIPRQRTMKRKNHFPNSFDYHIPPINPHSNISLGSQDRRCCIMTQFSMYHHRHFNIHSISSLIRPPG
jgi:hypothetical protein